MITKVWLCEALRNNWSEAGRLLLFKKGHSLIGVAVKVFGVTHLKRFQSEKDYYTRPNDAVNRHAAAVACA